MFQLVAIHAPVFRFPLVISQTADFVFPAEIRNKHPGFPFVEYFNDLTFVMPAPSHVWLLFYLLILGTISREP